MKKLRLSVATLLAIGIVAVSATGCKKESGPVGPAGSAGTNGTNGTDGTNGTNGVIISPADQTAYDAASANNGGLYYNKFWLNPADGTTLAGTDATITSNADFFRCKSCHGWDLLGTNGYYISRGPTGTRPNVAPNNLNFFAQTRNIKEVFDAVKHSGGRLKGLPVKSLNSNMPDYSLLMTDVQIWDIVKYLKEGRINSDKMYDLKTTGTYPTGSYVMDNLGKNGDATAGATYFSSKCASCHGATGTLQIPGTSTIGYLARNKSAEMNHLVKFGLPGQTMFSASFVHNITETEMVNMNKALADTTNFPD